MIIQAENICVKLGATVVFDNISLEIPPGKTLIVGSNGSGKTTLMKLFAGILKPSKGTIRVLGLDPVRDFKKLSRQVFFLRETSNTPPSFKLKTLTETLSRIYGRDKIEQVLKALRLEEHIDKKISELSHGLRRRADLLEPFASKRKLLLLDEPLNGLDYKSREIVSKLINEYTAGSIIVASHIPLQTSFDNLVVLEPGTLIYTGKYRQDIVEKYLHTTPNK